MAARPRLPRNAKRLPKGTNRHDYEPEVFAAWKRDRNRQRKEQHRMRLRHLGVRDCTFQLGKDARDNLAALCKQTGLTKSALLTFLLENANVQEPVQSQPADLA